MGSALVDREGLAMDLGRLEMDRDSSDLVFVVGQDEAKVSGHAAIFSVRCTKFVDLVSNNNNNIKASHNQGLTTVNLNFVGSEAFIKFVHYVYTGQLEVSASLSIYDLISISSLFGMDTLTKWCSGTINNKLNPRNAQRLLNEAAAISDRIPNKTHIIKPLLQWVGDNILTLRDRNLLDDLEMSALVLLVKSGCLSRMLSEIEIWRFCINWAKRKCDINPRKHPQIWSEQERSLVKLSLNEVIPFIKLHQIDSKTYREEVEPAGLGSSDGPGERERFRPGVSEASLGRLNIRAEMGGLRESAKYFLSSSILSGLGTVASQEISAHLNNWVGKPNQAWTTIFRASEHNFQARSFHQQCDGALPSLVIIRSDTGYVSGGYTDVPWSTSPAGKGRYVASDDSFLFSLHCPAGLNIRKFDIKKKMFAVSHHPNCGPIFGAGADLFISDNCNKVCDSYSNLPHSYCGTGDLSTASLMGDYNFIVEEYEVMVPIQN